MAFMSRIRNSQLKLWYLYNLKPSSVQNFNVEGINLLHTSSSRRVLEINMPSLSPTMAEGTIVSWQKKEGEVVNPGDVLCEIQTDKAVMAFEMEEEGTLAKIFMGDDSRDIKVGTLIALIAEPEEDWKMVSLRKSPSAEKLPTNDTTTIQPDQTHEFQGVRHAVKRPTILGPAVRHLLEHYGLSANNIPGSGPHGLLLKGDVLSHIEKGNMKPVTIVYPPPPVSTKPAAAAEKPLPAKKKVQNLSSNIEQEYQDLELTSMRRTIAKRLTQSKTGIAHAYSTIDCRIDSLLDLRKKCKLDGISLSVNDLVIKAVGTALHLCPDVNVVWKGDQLVQSPSVDVSVAVATDSGLITPIVTDVPLRGLQEINSVVRDLADRARLGRLQLHEFQGGSFTISNLGMYGIGEFSAIINPPQCGILAVGGGRLVVGDQGKPVTVMSATLSYDEEAVSSVAAAHFMSTLQNLLESPKNLLLGR